MKRIILLFFFSFNLYASDFALEVGGGLVVGTFDQRFSDIQSSTFNSSGMNFTGDMYGLELYAKLYMKNTLGTPFFIGIDSSMSFLSIEVMNLQLANAGYDPDLSANRIQIGPIVGLDFGIWWIPRIWGTYYLLDGFVLTDGDQNDTYIGSGYKLGLSFGSTWRFNIEYKSNEYDTRDGDKLPKRHTVNGVSLTEEKMETDEILLSVSFAVDL